MHKYHSNVFCLTITAKVFILSLVIFFLGCTTVTLDFKESTKVSGNIITCDEFGISNNDLSGVTVRLNDTGFATVTDDNGLFVMENVSFGTYDLIIEKQGYGSRIITSITFLEGDEDIQMGSIDLIQISSIEITDFKIEKEGFQLYASGNISHKFPYILNQDEYIPHQKSLKGPRIEIFFSDEQNVSNKDFIRSFSYEVFVASGSDFRIPLNWVISWPTNPGETYYYVAYGVSNFFWSYQNGEYNSDTGFEEWNSTLLGRPSNVTSLTKDK